MKTSAHLGGTGGLAMLVVVGGAAGSAKAQLAINWYPLDGGGGTSSGGTFVISGTLASLTRGRP